MRRRTLIYACIAGGAVATGAGMFFTRPERRSQPQSSSLLPEPLSEMRWELVDDRGEKVTPQMWRGRPVMVFFGFTWCPDLCPTTLMDISDWLEELGPEADDIAVSLITVDPDRDTQAALADYLASFDPRIRGLRGSAREIARAADAFRAVYRKVERSDGDYTMEHTSGVFLFRRTGHFASVIDFHEDRATAVPKIQIAMRDT